MTNEVKVTQEAIEDACRRMVRVNAIDWDEVCARESDPIDGECESSTCVAAWDEEHDPDEMRSHFRKMASEAIAPLLATIEAQQAEIERLRALVGRSLEREYNPFEPDNQSKLYRDLAAALDGEG